MNNKEIVQLFRAIAAAYEIKKENRFKIIAYQRAADAVEHATSEIKDLWEDGNLKQLPGIGASISSHLFELFTQGKVKHWQEVLADLPPAIFEMISVPGIGPKTAHKLCKNLGISKAHSALSKLEKAAKEGKIKNIPTFGAESEAEILRGLQEHSRRLERILLPKAHAIAQDVLEYLKRSGHIQRADPLGSLRRMSATVGDIDIAVASDRPKLVIEHFIRYPKKKRVLGSGESKASLVIRSGEQVDIMIKPIESYGALLQHFTGSKHHNIHLREIAQKKGLSLSEYGIKKGKKIIECRTEEEFYRLLGMAWIPPELREDAGEIEVAQKRKIPKLVEAKEVRSDFHVHSDFPLEPGHDAGENSLEEMIEKAIRLKYDYIGLADHSPSTSQHSPEQIIRLIMSRNEKIEQLRSKYKNYSKRVNLLNSIEVDILTDGQISIPDKALKTLDLIIASIHSSFRQPKQKMTERILRALSNPYVKILGHPTGRLLLTREGYEADWNKIFKFCQTHDKWLEINSMPTRLDLPDTLVREAIKYKVKIVIGTDAHKTEHMDFMFYGASVARRGWASKNDIINTLPYSNLIGILKKLKT